MYNLCRNIRLTNKINGFVSRRTVSNVTRDQLHQPDATPQQIRLVNARLQIRKALRAEYLRKCSDPHSTDPIIFDPMMQRYYTLHMTLTERFVPTFRNWCVFMCSIILPVVAYAQYLRYSKSRFERRCRSGEISYKDRRFKYQ